MPPFRTIAIGGRAGSGGWGRGAGGSVEPGACHPMPPVSSEVPNDTPLLTRNVRGKNCCTSAPAELLENRLSFESLSIVVGREGGISVISHCH